MAPPSLGGPIESEAAPAAPQAPVAATANAAPAPPPPGKKKGRTNTPWTAEEEQRLKAMRDAGNTWAEIAKVCPTCCLSAGFGVLYAELHGCLDISITD